jgi:hypothetical protein
MPAVILPTMEIQQHSPSTHSPAPGGEISRDHSGLRSAGRLPLKIPPSAVPGSGRQTRDGGLQFVLPPSALGLSSARAASRVMLTE